MDQQSHSASRGSENSSAASKMEEANHVDGQGRLRIVVDLNRCQGYAQCCYFAPSVFRLHGDEILTYYPEPDGAIHEEVLRAVASCPVQAIYVEQLSTRKDELQGEKEHERK